MVNVLFTSVGRRLELLGAFKQAYADLGLAGTIVGVDVDRLAPALRQADRPYIVPRVSDPAYILTLADICRRERVHLIFPLIDPDIPILACHRRQIEATGARVVVVSQKAATTSGDKWLTYQFFRHLDVPTPRSWLPEQVQDLELDYPVFIKPRFGSAGKHAFQVRNERELTFFLDYVREPIVQEYLPGPEITNDVVCDFEDNVLAIVSRQRIEVRRGEVTKAKTIYDHEIMQHCVTVGKGLEAIGPITVQCILRDGVPYFTEINARFGGGVPLGIAAGVQSPRWFLALAAGLPVEIPPLGSYRAGLYVTRFDDAFFLTEEELLTTESAKEAEYNKGKGRKGKEGKNEVVRAVMFDLDDTLYPEQAFVLSGFRAVAAWVEERLGIPAEQGFTELRHLFNEGVRGNTFDRWLAGHGFNTDGLIPQMLQVYREHHPLIEPYSEVPGLLQRLSRNYRLGLLSDGYLGVQQRKLDALGLRSYFDAVVFSDEWGRAAWKPSTQPFEAILGCLEVQGTEAVYIADNPSKDFLGARKVNMWTVRVRRQDGLYSHLEPTSGEEAAHAEIECLDQLEGILERIGESSSHA